MKKKNHTPEQITEKLRKVEALTAQGQTVAQTVRPLKSASRPITDGSADTGAWTATSSSG